MDTDQMPCRGQRVSVLSRDFHPGTDSDTDKEEAVKMELSLNGIKDTAAWENAGIKLPGYDVAHAARKARTAPRWAHFGIGNIFRIFIGGIVDGMLENGNLDTSLTCVETFDYDVVDDIYRPYDNLGLSVILHETGERDYKVLGCFGEAVKARSTDPEQWNRLKEIFASPSLQMVSFTITEKGYALTDAAGNYFPFVQADIDNGPEKAGGAMGVVAAMLLERYRKGAAPLALVSMDNCSQNGQLLRSSVLTMAEEWLKRGFVEEGFVSYVEDESTIAFPWTMIDKITPRPNPDIAADLEALGVEKMQPVETSKRTYIAPFINGEDPQYLVIEDSFPNGRPPLEKGKGVFLGSRRTVNQSERMKVTALLNPVHSALAPLGVLLGEEYFAHMLNHDPRLMKLARTVAYTEGLPMVESPGIIDPKAFADELLQVRFVNEYLLDTNLRIVTDESQGLGVRFGETIKAYTAKYGSADRLIGIPLGIAGWLRYMMAVDDQGNSYVLAPDPMAGEIQEILKDVVIGKPETLKDQLKPVLSNEKIFFTDLYQNGLGEKVEELFREMIAGKGAVRDTIDRYM